MEEESNGELAFLDTLLTAVTAKLLVTSVILKGL